MLGNLKIDFNQDDSRIIVGDKEKVDEFSFKYTFCVYRKCYINRMAGVFLILGYLAAMDAKITIELNWTEKIVIVGVAIMVSLLSFVLRFK